MRLTKPRRELARKQYGSAEDRSRDEALNASEELFSQRYDDAPWTPHVAQPVEVLVLGHFAHEFGAAVGAHASDSVLDAFNCKHDAPEAQRVRRCDRRFDLDQFWIAKLRQLKVPVPIWGAHHNDVDSDTFEPVDAVHPLSLYRRLTLLLQTELGKESDSGCKVLDDDTDVVQSLDRHGPSIGQAECDGPGRLFLVLGSNPADHLASQIATKELGRFFVGAEKEEEYAELAARRIGASERGGVLRELPHLSARDG
jgi:hypothetical protein